MRPQIKGHTNFQVDQLLMYNSLFENFLSQCFGMALPDLAGALEYTINFYGVPLSFELPSAAQQD